MKKEEEEVKIDNDGQNFNQNDSRSKTVFLKVI